MAIHEGDEATVGGLADISISFARALFHALGTPLNGTFRSYPATC